MSAQGFTLGQPGICAYSLSPAITNLNAGSGDPATEVYGYLDREDGLIEPGYFPLSSSTGVGRSIYSTYYQPYASAFVFGVSGSNIYGDTISNTGWTTLKIVNSAGIVSLARTSASFSNPGYEAQWSWSLGTNPLSALTHTRIIFV
jgi:hypothetical protein